ncbi:MAG TPA: transglutaminase-like domain-containing protein, partial [Verrucomicrobiae bacterium]|nr:transglutaminase-like domain-containing protein [Verrucomicrobiae bacterium]
GVDVGSTIEVEFEITSEDRPYLAGFESFQLPDEMDHKSFQLTAPPNVKIQQMVNGEQGAIKEESKVDDRQQSLTWQADHVKALPAETQLPPEWAYGAGVSYFVGDMKTYLKDLNDTLLAQSQKRAKTEGLVRELTAQTGDKLDKVKAIRDFVAKSIRLAGPSFTELPLSELSPADTTLADGYGHAADRAILLHAMLSAAGFQPEFVLASGLPPIESITNVAETFPLPNTFQMPLVRVSVDGETYYLNDTDQYAKLGSTGSDQRLGLVLASQSYEMIKAAKGCGDKTETVYTLAASDSGKTRVGVERRFYGTHYNGQNRYFSELPPEERRRYFQEVVSGMAQGARPLGDLVTRFDTYPGVEQYAVEVDNYSVVDGKYFYFDLPFTPSMFPVGADHRTLPLFLAHRGESEIRTEIDLPTGFRHVVISPKSETLDAPDGSGKARITATETDGKCVITHDFESTPAIVQPKDYQAMLKVESTLRNKSSKLFLLEKD